MIYPNADDFFSICPHAHHDIVNPLVMALPDVCEKAEINSVNRLSNFIGQCTVESAYWTTYEEFASGRAYEGRHDLGNVHPGDGVKYKGRGPIQLTGHNAYFAATPFVRQFLNRPDLDLVKTPQIVADDKAVGLATSVWFWLSHNLNHWSDYGTGNNSVERITHIVNGGHNALLERELYTHKWLLLITKIQDRAPPAPVDATFQSNV